MSEINSPEVMAAQNKSSVVCVAWQGPIPHPDVVEGCQKLVPDAAVRFRLMVSI